MDVDYFLFVQCLIQFLQRFFFRNPQQVRRGPPVVPGPQFDKHRSNALTFAVHVTLHTFTVDGEFSLIGRDVCLHQRRSTSSGSKAAFIFSCRLTGRRVVSEDDLLKIYTDAY
jgi:hypothetical protein